MTITLKCLSLRQPYASLVVAGVKTIETRTSGVLSKHRGPLLIAASQGKGAALDEWGRDRYDWQQPDGWERYPRGVVLGVVYVQAVGKPVVPMNEYPYWQDTLTALTLAMFCGETAIAMLQREACFGDPVGRWLAFLSCAAWLAEPVPVKGRLGLYPVTLDADLLPEWARPEEG